jgi:hypothetical protein
MASNRRMQGGFALVAAAGAAICVATVWMLRESAPAAAACTKPIPQGRSVQVAWDTTELFVSTVLLNDGPACGYDLSTRHLRHGHSRAEWAHGRAGVRRFATGYGAVPIAQASRDPQAQQAVYILSRRVENFVVIDARGRATIPMMVGLAAPQAGRGAYNLLLVVENGSWRVDEVRRVTIRDSG